MRQWHSYRKYFTSVVIVSTSTLIGIGVVSKITTDSLQKSTEIPFEIKEEKRIEMGGRIKWEISLVLSSQYFSKEKLDWLFRSYSKKHPSNKEELHVKVYASSRNWEQDRNVEFPDDFGLPGSILPRDASLHRTLYDAVFYRQGHGAIASGGDNEWYIYRPELGNPDKTQVVILKGTLRSRPKELIGDWETKRGGLKIRLITYELPDVIPRGIYHTFQSSQGEGTSWSDIMTVRKETLASPRGDQVVFINEQVAFIFMDWIYAVTTDGGRTWFTWDTEQDFPSIECCDYTRIQEVYVSSDGKGIMKISRLGEIQELHTKDYGKQWQKD